MPSKSNSSKLASWLASIFFIFQALEYSQKGEKTPSCILPASDGTGGLFHGGFKGVMNSEFLRKEGVTHVVNTAKGLEIFGPKYMVCTCTSVAFTPRRGLINAWWYSKTSCALVRSLGP